MKTIISSIFIFFLLTISASAKEHELTIGISTGYPPFYYFDKNKQPTGICIDIVKAIAKELGINIKFESYPWKRMLYNGKKGKVDAIMPLFKTKERESYLMFPDTELIMEANNFFTHISNPLAFNGKLQDMMSYHIGVIDTYSYGKDFDQTRFIRKSVTKDEAQLIKLVQYKRIHLGIGNKLVIEYYANMTGATEHLKFLFPPVTEAPLFIGFSKQTITPKFVNKFNDSLSNLKKTKYYQQILKKYQ